MKGDQPMQAIGLGMIGQELFPKFNEMMKRRKIELGDDAITFKINYKAGIIRIW